MHAEQQAALVSFGQPTLYCSVTAMIDEGHGQRTRRLVHGCAGGDARVCAHSEG